MDLLQWQILTQRLDSIDAAIASVKDALLTRITAMEQSAMAIMDDLEAKMEEASTRGEVAEALLDTIHQELVDILNSGATPARLQALADHLQVHSDSLQSAADRNPVPPPPPPPPGP